jgi:hypothetical protein
LRREIKVPSFVRFSLVFAGTLLGMMVVFLFVFFVVSYSLLFIHFTGPDSIAEHCFEIGFACAVLSSLTLAALVGWREWKRYSAVDPD